MQRRDDQERIASANSNVKNAKLAEIVNFAKIKIEIVILIE